MFGSTVTVASMGAEGFNDSGQIGFSYTLADGRSGVAVASPVPEPTAIMFDALGALGLLFPATTRFQGLRLDQFETREILGIDHADGSILRIDHDEIVDPVLLQHVQDFGGQALAADGDRMARHELLDR